MLAVDISKSISCMVMKFLLNDILNSTIYFNVIVITTNSDVIITSSFAKTSKFKNFKIIFSRVISRCSFNKKLLC